MCWRSSPPSAPAALVINGVLQAADPGMSWAGVSFIFYVGLTSASHIGIWRDTVMSSRLRKPRPARLTQRAHIFDATNGLGPYKDRHIQPSSIAEQAC
jgi:hypothetical protein